MVIKFYQHKVFPYFMNKNIGKLEIINYRQSLLSEAYGKILEIGIGTGINLNLYPESISEITAVDPFVREIPKSRVKVILINESSESMSFDSNTFDTVVSTFCFCSVKNTEVTLKELRRILKPGGKLLFLEHGKADRKFLQTLQNVLNPLFNIFACGCNVNRDYAHSITSAGFRLEEIEMNRVNIFPKAITGYLYKGVAYNDKD